MDYKCLTPVKKLGHILFKQDDQFYIFENDSINGNKLRQAIYIIENQGLQCEYLITGCSLISPQAPIIAGVSKYFNKKCFIVYGGTNYDNISKNYMSRLANYYGAEILIAKSGRHTVLSSYIDSFLDKNKGGFKINYGMNLKTNIIDYFDLLALQVQNIPEGIENIIIPCGSSISSIGILYGSY